MFRLVAPAGAPIRVTDIAGALFGRNRDKTSENTQPDFVRDATGSKHAFLVNSGRTALTLAIRALRQTTDSSRNEIVLPAYTCYSVPAAVVRAGMKVRLVDIDPRTLDYRYDSLERADLSRVVAIVGCNLLGIPSDWKKLRALADDRGVFLIDDAAQAMGLKYGGRQLGTLGDVGFYSLGRGKNLSTYSGGVLLTSREDVAEIIADEYSTFQSSGAGGSLSVALKLLIVSIFLRPWLYWIPAGMPALKLGQTVYEESFEMGRLSDIQSNLVRTLWQRLDEFNSHRLQVSQKLADGLASLGQFHVPGLLSSEIPAYLRFPILAPSSDSRRRMTDRLRKAGITAGKLYPQPLSRIDQKNSYLAADCEDDDGAREVSERMFTLPTHPYVTDKDVKRMLEILTDEGQV